MTIKWTPEGKVDRRWLDETPQHIAADQLADALDVAVAALRECARCESAWPEELQAAAPALCQIGVSDAE